MYRGIDAPEMNMEYGQEAKDALTKLIQGKPLTIHVYEKDRYDRLVGDVYCNGIFVQVIGSIRKKISYNCPLDFIGLKDSDVTMFDERNNQIEA